MKVKAHYGWVDIGDENPYSYIRKTHHFLTDDNHTYKDTGNSIIVSRNEKSPTQHPIAPMWVRFTDYWFSVPYTIQ